jgi:hypothetical protein
LTHAAAPLDAFFVHTGETTASALLFFAGCAAATAASESVDSFVDSFQGLGFPPGSNGSIAYAISVDVATIAGQGDGLGIEGMIIGAGSLA